MKEEKRRNKVRQYNEEEIFRKLKDKYGITNCIRIKEFIYIVYENNTYYLMSKSVPEIFDISKATKLTKLVVIKEDSDGSINATIREKNKNVFVTMLKSDIINEIKQWG